MSKLFTVAGTSVNEGVLKFRVANGGAAARIKVLEKNGHTEINLQDLPKPMSKEDAMSFLNYVEGKSIETKAPAKTPKSKVVQKEIKIPNKAPAKSTKTPEELAAIKAKNLQTMREVSARRGDYTVLHQTVRAEFELIEQEMDKLTAADIPQMFRKECGFAE